MSSQPPLDHIGYQDITAQAMRSVPRLAMAKVENLGSLPGEHHFVLTFSTTHPGVDISRLLKKRFATEMTIAIQHQYADLHVAEDAFEVVLKFDGRPETLYVPFAAIIQFSDPSVPFAIDFGPVSHPDTPQSEQPNQSGTPLADSSTDATDDTVVSLDAFRTSK